MSGSVSVFHGAVVTPACPRTWKALPRCLIVVGRYGNIDFMCEHVEDDKLDEVLREHWYADHHVKRLQDGEFIIPGFVDTHTHAPQFPNLGKGGRYTLLQWLEKVTFPKEAEFANTKFAKEVYHEVVRRSLAFGTTTSCYYGSLHLTATTILADIVNHHGQRAFIGKCNMDRKETLPHYYVEDSAEQSIKETEDLIQYIRSLVPRSRDAAIGTAPEPLVQPILTPRFALACTKACLSGLRDLVHRYNREHPDEPRIRIQTHIAENRKEVKEVLRRYPEAESYSQVYDDYDLLRDTTVLGHSIHLSPGEVLMIKKRDAGISHCPTSNFYLSSGIAPVGEYLDAGIKVGLGTDVSGGYAVSMLNVIQNASIASKILAIEAGLPDPEQVPCQESVDNEEPAPAPDAPPSVLDHHYPHHHTIPFANRQLPIPTLFYLATLGGARVCNLSEKIGSFSEGKSFDALVVSVLDDTGATGVWGMEAKSDGDHKKRREKLEENLERFMFCGDDRNILKVYVQGCLVGGRSFVPQ